MASTKPFTVTAFGQANFENILGAGDQACSLFVHLKSLGAKCIVQEHQYVDLEFLEDYSRFYSRCFQRYDKHCERLHFFNRTLSAKTLLSYIRNPPEESQLQDSYLGFLVVRPLKNAPIGRTVIKVRNPSNSLCDRTYDANLFGIPLRVRSVAFQQQDSAVAACATIAVWSSLHKASELFKRPIPSPAEITINAHRASDKRPIPSKGLDVQQICATISATGLDPEIFESAARRPLLSNLIAYLSLGIPVILGVDVAGQGHALAVTGYELKNSPSKECADPNIPPLTGRMVKTLYAHDDAKGPFSELRVLPPARGQSKYPFVLKGPWKDPMLPKTIAIPVNSRIRASFLDILEWINPLHEMAREVEYILHATPVSTKPDPLNWDIGLVTTNQLKAELRASNYPQKSITRLSLLTHPEYVWRVRLTSRKATMLELYADATEAPKKFPFYGLVGLDAAFVGEFAYLISEGNREICRSVLKPPAHDFLLEHLRLD